MKTIELKIAQNHDGLEATLTRIGRVSLLSELPQTLVEGMLVGQLTTLRNTYALVLPSGGPWLLRHKFQASRDVGLGVGAPLLALKPYDENVGDSEEGANQRDGVLYNSPMAGQFYGRPAPEQPLFVNVGDEIQSGQQLGLVEVMKFFYPLIFEKTGRWRVTELIAGESKSLEAGDPVIRIEAVE